MQFVGTAWVRSGSSVMLAQVAPAKYGSYPNVISEPYNEPNGTGTTWPEIKPYHEAVVKAIRDTGSKNVIILGTPTYSQDVDIASKDQVAGSNLMYTLHFYACTHAQKLRDKADVALANGAPLFVTEFGATPADGGVIPTATKKGSGAIICEPETSNWFAWMAQNNISGAAWKLDQCTDSSCILASNAPVDGPWTETIFRPMPMALRSPAACKAAATACSSSTGFASSRKDERLPIALREDGGAL